MGALDERERTIICALDEVRELEAVREALSAGNPLAAAEGLGRLRARVLQRAPAVPISLAAKLLDVSGPTARALANRGALKDVPSRPRGVSLESLILVLAALRDLRAQANSVEFRRALLARIDDAITVGDPQAALSITQMKAAKTKHYVHRKG